MKARFGRRSAFGGTADSSVVQRGNCRLIDLHNGGGHRLFEAGLPGSHSAELAALKRRAHGSSGSAKSGIKHLGTLFSVKVQDTVADDNCVGLRWLGRLRLAADHGAAESEEAGGANRGN